MITKEIYAGKQTMVQSVCYQGDPFERNVKATKTVLTIGQIINGLINYGDKAEI